MSLTIKVRKDGPYAIDLTTGEFNLIDHEGKAIALPQGKTTIALCRCGASVNKPFCDGTHSRIGFKAAQEAQKEFDSGSAA